MGVLTENENGGLDGKGLNHNAKYRKEKYVRMCSSNLLLMIVVTAVNIVLLFISGSYFFFSAHVPYLLSYFGAILSSPELCAELNLDYPDLGNLPLIVTLVVAAILLGLYLLCWAMSRVKKMGVSVACSKKARSMLIVALILYGIDTLVLLPDAISGVMGGELSMILCLLFHIWVVYYLIQGIRGYNADIKELLDAPVTVEAEATVPAQEE